MRDLSNNLLDSPPLILMSVFIVSVESFDFTRMIFRNQFFLKIVILRYQFYLVGQSSSNTIYRDYP